MVTRDEAKDALRMLVNDIRNEDEKLFGKENMTANHITWVGTIFEYLGEDAPSPPAEMPVVAPCSPDMEAPLTYGRCILYREEKDDKKADTCIGCKVAGCAAKGRT